MIVLGTLLWSALMSISATLHVMHWATDSSALAISILFGLGALPAVPVTAFAMSVLSRWLRYDGQRFALSFLLLASVTIGCTALFFALLYREMYVEGHAESFSRIWMLQFIFTTVSAFYQFAVLGMRLYFPLGLAALFTFSLWLGIRSR